MRFLWTFALCALAVAQGNEICVDDKSGVVSSSASARRPEDVHTSVTAVPRRHVCRQRARWRLPRVGGARPATAPQVAPYSPKGSKCYTVGPAPPEPRHFLHPLNFYDFATSECLPRPSTHARDPSLAGATSARRRAAGQPWYNYCLLAWILSAAEHYFG